jgi:hypothetical protein
MATVIAIDQVKNRRNSRGGRGKKPAGDRRVRREPAGARRKTDPVGVVRGAAAALKTSLDERIDLHVFHPETVWPVAAAAPAVDAVVRKLAAYIQEEITSVLGKKTLAGQGSCAIPHMVIELENAELSRAFCGPAAVSDDRRRVVLTISGDCAGLLAHDVPVLPGVRPAEGEDERIRSAAALVRQQFGGFAAYVDIGRRVAFRVFLPVDNLAGQIGGDLGATASFDLGGLIDATTAAPSTTAEAKPGMSVGEFIKWIRASSDPRRIASFFWSNSEK